MMTIKQVKFTKSNTQVICLFVCFVFFFFFVWLFVFCGEGLYRARYTFLGELIMRMLQHCATDTPENIP